MLITDQLRLTCSHIEVLSGIAFLDDELARLHFALVHTVDNLAHLRRVQVFEKIVVHDRVSNHLLRSVAGKHSGALDFDHKLRQLGIHVTTMMAREN